MSRSPTKRRAVPRRRKIRAEALGVFLELLLPIVTAWSIYLFDALKAANAHGL